MFLRVYEYVVLAAALLGLALFVVATWKILWIILAVAGFVEFGRMRQFRGARFAGAGSIAVKILLGWILILIFITLGFFVYSFIG